MINYDKYRGRDETVHEKLWFEWEIMIDNQNNLWFIMTYIERTVQFMLQTVYYI